MKWLLLGLVAPCTPVLYWPNDLAVFDEKVIMKLRMHSQKQTSIRPSKYCPCRVSTGVIMWLKASSGGVTRVWIGSIR